jgi:hypothetical protein
MNEKTNEPKVEMPEPPEGHRWEYRGRGWTNRDDDAEVCYIEDRIPGFYRKRGYTTGYPDTRYWEAVPAPKTVKQWLETLPDGYRERALANLFEPEKTVANLATAITGIRAWSGTPEKYNFWSRVYGWAIDPDTHTLPPLPVDLTESRERFDRACDDHLAEENRKLKAEIVELKAELAAFKSPPIKSPEPAEKLDALRRELPQPDYAQQAKDILHGVLDPGNPFIDEHGISKFVDLIIKAAKQ